MKVGLKDDHVPSSMLCYKPKEFLQRNKSFLAHEGQTDKSNESWLIANQKFLANPFIVAIIIIIINNIMVREGVKKQSCPTESPGKSSLNVSFVFLCKELVGFTQTSKSEALRSHITSNLLV